MAKFVLTAQLELQAPKNVSQVVNKIQSQLQGIKIDVQAQAATKAAGQVRDLTNATNQAATSASKLGKTFQASVKRFGAIAIATRAVSLFTNTLANSIREAIAFERELVKISQVTGKSIQQLQFLTSTVSNLSTQLGVSSTSLINVSRILSQAGLSAQETTIALGTLARTELAPTFDDISETAEGAIAIFNQFRAGAAALEAQLGAVNAVAGQFAVEAGDLISVVRRTGGVFKSAGGDLNELIALFTSVRSTTRESAESIATGLRTIFTRIQRPKTIEFLRQYGIELLDLEGKFVGPYEATRRLSEALDGLAEGDITFVRIAEELGGFRQIGKVIPLLQQFSVAESALEVATEGANSLTEDQIKAQASLAIQIQKVQEQFANLVRNITATSTFQALAKTLLDLASAFIKIADALSPVIPLLTAFAAIKFASNIGGLGGLLGGLGGKKFAQGGQVFAHHRNVMAFARGGMVPGSGNRDTVPAMLTPGEFVIKKSSVAKLGAGNLEAMNNNKFADGGKINVNPGAIGGFFLTPEQGDPRKFQFADREVNINNKTALSKLGYTDPTGTLSDEEYFFRASAEEKAKLLGRGTKVNKFLAAMPKDPTQAKIYIAKAQKGDQNQQTAAANFNKDFQLNKSKLSAKREQSGDRNVLLSGGITGYFPGKDDLQNSAVAKQVRRSTSKVLYDGVLEASQAIAGGLDSSVPQIKLNKNFLQDGASRSSSDPQALRTVEGYVFEGIVNALTGASLSGGQAAFDFPASSISASRDGLKNLFTSSTGEGIDQLIKADAKRSASTDAFNSIVNKIVQDINKGNTEGLSFSKFAKGGSVGTDTVPALLTPGEFVVNRESAQRIGYGKLNKMNKVAKFAKGGVVGKKVKAFADGGASGGGANTGTVMIDVAPINVALSQVTNALVLQMETLSQVTNALVNLGISSSTVAEGMITQLAATNQLSKATADEATAKLKSNVQTLKNIKTANNEETQRARNVIALQKAEKASNDAALADEKEAKSSQKMAQNSESGLSAGLKFNLMLGGITTALSLLSPTIDETSGYFDYLLKNTTELAMQVSVVTGLLGNFASFEGFSNAIGALDGKLGGAITKSVSKFGVLDKTTALMSKANKAAAAVETAETATNVLSSGTEVVESGADAAEAVASGAAASGAGALAAALLATVAVVAIIVATFYLLNSAAADAAKAAKERAIEDGNAAEAAKQAEKEAVANAKGSASTSGALFGAALGLAIGGPVGAIVGAALVGGLAQAFTTGNALVIDAAKKRAAADALATKASNALSEQQDKASDAMKEFEAGTASVYDVLAASAEAMNAAAESRKAAEEAQVAGIKKATAYYFSLAGTLRNILSYLTGGAISSAEDIMAPELKEDEKRVKQARKGEMEAVKNDPGIRILQKQVAAAGGSFEDFMKMLPEEQRKLISGNAEVYDKVKKQFENIAKEAERTRKAFDAMNLGLHGVTAAAGAVTQSLNNYLAAQEAGNIKIERSIATLEAGVTSAAMGMDPAVFQDALSDAGSTLASFGATEEQVAKFQENMNAINQAQVSFAKSSQDAKNKMIEDFQRGAKGATSLDEKKGVLAESVVMNLGPDVSDEVKNRISDAIKGGKLSEADMQKIMDGNFEPLSKVLGDLGKQTLEQVLPALKAQAEAEKAIIGLRKKIIQYEQQYINARKRTIDVEMEAAAIKEEFGGPAVTTQQKESAILKQANLDAEGLGVGNLQAGSAAELTKRNAAIQNQLNSIYKVRNDAAAGDRGAQDAMAGESGVQLAAQQERLEGLAQQNYETTKKLIDLKRQEIKVIQARNKAEKDAMKSLMAGDIEAFLDKQAAIGAGAAIAVGDTGLARSFGSSAIGGAFQNFEEMQQSGVQDYFGQKIGGRGGLLEQTGTAFGFGKDQARVLAGTTQEEETLKAEARALADTLPQTAKIQENAAKQNLINAQMQMEAAKMQLQAAKDRVAKVMAKADEDPTKKEKPTVTQTPDTPKAKDKSDKPDPSPLSVGIARLMDAFTGTTNAQDKLAQNTSYTSPSEQARQQAQASSTVAGRTEPTSAAQLATPPTLPSDSATQPVEAAAGQKVATQESTGAAIDTGALSQLTAGLSSSVQAMTTLSASLDSLSNVEFKLQGVDNFEGSINTFGQHIDAFSTVVKSIESMSLKVQVGNSNVSVDIREPAFLSELTGKLKTEILTEVQNKLDNLKQNGSGQTVSTSSQMPQ